MQVRAYVHGCVCGYEARHHVLAKHLNFILTKVVQFAGFLNVSFDLEATGMLLA